MPICTFGTDRYVLQIFIEWLSVRLSNKNNWLCAKITWYKMVQFMAINNYLTVDVINLCVTILELVKYIYYYEMLNVLQ